MASSNPIPSMTIFIIALPLVAFGDLILNIFRLPEICNNVVCGKGTCKTGASVAPYGVICECDNGWRRTLNSDTDEQYLKFLPCVVPNCSIHYGCMSAVPALPPVSPDDSWNTPSYNLGYTADTHTCQCRPRAFNILNLSHFPCYKDCTIGADCSSLGINVSGKSTVGSEPSSSSGQDSGSQIHGNLSWVILLKIAAFGVFFLWM